MYIKNLIIDGIKGVGGEFDLKPVTLITGDNFEGKTRLAEALRVGLIGYDPALGKTNGKTFELASGDEMRIELYTDTGEEVNVVMLRNAEGSISCERKGELLVPSELLDLDVYFEKTEADRIAYIFNAIETAIDAEKIVAELGKLEVLPAKPGKVAVAKVVEKAKGLLKGKRKPQEWLVAVLTTLREELKKATSQHKAQAGALAGLRKASGDIVPKDCAVALAGQREALEKLLKSQGNPDTGAFSRAQAEIAEIKEHLEILKEQFPLNPKMRELMEKPEHESEVEKIEALLVKNRDEIRQHTERAAQAEADLADITKDADEKLKNECCPLCKTPADWRKSFIKYTAELQDGRRRIINEAFESTEKLRETRKNLNSALSLAQQMDAASEYREIFAKLKTLEAIPKPQEPDRTEERKIRAKIAELEIQDRGFNTWKANNDQRNKIEEEVVTLATSIEATKLAIEHLVEVQEREIEKAMEALLATANRFTDGILKLPLVWRNGTFGMENGRFWSHRTFSGTEKLLAYAGISFALARQSPLRIFILDEMARLTKKRKALVYDRALELVQSGDVDQIILIDAEGEGYPKAPKKNTIFGRIDL